jgi:hypothetical protein
MLGRQWRGAGDSVGREEEVVGAGCSRKSKQNTDEVASSSTFGTQKRPDHGDGAMMTVLSGRSGEGSGQCR